MVCRKFPVVAYYRDLRILDFWIGGSHPILNQDEIKQDEAWALTSLLLLPQVTTVAADQSFTIRDLASGSVKLNVERCSLGHLTRRGLYLAFHNPGSCVALVSVRVFYQRCAETVHGLAHFPDTLPGPGGLVEVAGTCLSHAQISLGSSGTPRMHCSPDGEWLVPVGQCQCEPGYEESSGNVGCIGEKWRVIPLLCVDQDEAMSWFLVLEAVNMVNGGSLLQMLAVEVLTEI